MTLTCSDCGAEFPAEALADHFRQHAQELPDFERWPDGTPVLYENDPKPEDVL